MKDIILKVIELLKGLLGMVEGNATPSDPMPWFTAAKKDVGQKEILGSKDNPFIVECFKYTTYHATHDEVPWCAAYICMRLEKAGYKSTKSAAAASYDKYGTDVSLRVGAIVTIKHADGGRHVTMCYDVQGTKDSFLALGGNQGNSVKVSSYPKAHIVGIRWPVKT